MYINIRERVYKKIDDDTVKQGLENTLSPI